MLITLMPHSRGTYGTQEDMSLKCYQQKRKPVIGSAGTGDMDEGTDYYEARTELDSHANMAVVGKHAFILSTSEKTTEVHPYHPDYDPKTVPIVDVTVQYDCPFSNETYVLLIRHALYIPSMSNNLIPPFMLRESGLIVDDVPKIQHEDPAVEHHCI